MGRPRGAGAQRYDRPPREASDVKSEALRVRLLGIFLVSVGAHTVDEREWRLKKAASLIKLLALAPGHRLHRELAIDLLWPDLDPKAAANNLHHALHVARRTLEPTSSTASRYLRLRDGRISLCPDWELWVDVEAFEDAAAARRARGVLVSRLFATHRIIATDAVTNVGICASRPRWYLPRGCGRPR